MSLIKIDPAKVEAKRREVRIAELKKFLSETDYKVLPDYDKTDGEVISKRQAWREEIRSLEASDEPSAE
jgi:hypothetical protein